MLFRSAGFYLARDKGFYRDAGLDVTLLHGDSRRSALTMLEDGQAVIKLPGDVLVADDSDDATHVARSPLGDAR
mgnify:CR=1 FL=1